VNDQHGDETHQIGPRPLPWASQNTANPAIMHGCVRGVVGRSRRRVLVQDAIGSAAAAFASGVSKPEIA